MSGVTAGASAAAEELTDDAFLGGALRILQPESGYRAGLDAVLLAAAVPARPGEAVIDIGAGAGVVGLAVARRVADARVTLVERDPRLAGLARSNIERNGLSGRVQLIESDIVRAGAGIAEAAEGFHHAVANPPFHIEGCGTAAGDPLKAGSHAMGEGDLDRWMRFAARMVRPGGTGTVIHRAEALHAVMSACSGRFGGVLVLPIHPREHEPASRVLVHGIKGSRAAMQLRPALVLHTADHGFRSSVEAILRHGAPLVLRKVATGS